MNVNVLWEAEVNKVVLERVARGKEGRAIIAHPMERPVKMRLVLEGANGDARTTIQINTGVGWVDVQFPDRPERAAMLLDQMKHLAVRGDGMPKEFGHAIIVSNTDGLAIVLYVLAEADGTAKGYITAKAALPVTVAFIGVEIGFATFLRANGKKGRLPVNDGMKLLTAAFHSVGAVHYTHSAPSGTVVKAFDEPPSKPGLPHTPQRKNPPAVRPSDHNWGMDKLRQPRIMPA